MHNMRKTREERKWERSQKSSRAATLGWARYHAAKAAAGIVEIYELPRLDTEYRITVENLMTNKSHTLTLHPGPRRDNFSIDLDGKPWRTMGFSGIMAVLRKSLCRTKSGRVI